MFSSSILDIFISTLQRSHAGVSHHGYLNEPTQPLFVSIKSQTSLGVLSLHNNP